jgi:hypothetical protein
VTGTNNPAQTVTWTIETTDVAEGTQFTGAVLTVAEGETKATITVKATSTADTSKSGEATVTVAPEGTTPDDIAAANTFTATTHAAILAKTVGTVAISDEAAVNAALTTYDSLSADAQALLMDEKVLLDNLKAKIEALIATGSTVTVNLWTNDTTVLATADSVTLSRAAAQTALITGLNGNEYYYHQWSINGIDIAAPWGTDTTFSFNSARKDNGKYNIELQVQKNDIWYSKTITITVTD